MTKKRAKVPLSPPSRPARAPGSLHTPVAGDLAGPADAAASFRQRPRSISLSSPLAAVGVAMLSKNLQHRVDFCGTNDVFRLGEMYLNDLSDIRVFELSNSKPRRLRVNLKAELRKPFHASVCNFQLENENLSLVEEHAPRSDLPPPVDEYNHVPASVVRASAKAALCAENPYLSDGYNELFNQIATVQDVVLEPHETKRVVLSLCAKLSSSSLHAQPSQAHADSSEEERMHLHETSCLLLAGRITVKARYEDLPVSAATMPRMPSTPPLPLGDVIVPLQGKVCRSLLRLDVKELHFDDCIPGGSFVKDFTVWNRSEIPLLFQLVSSVALFDDARGLLTFTDYNSGYRINGKTVQAAAYGHVRIRVTYRPTEIGERFVEVHVQNLHDSRNAKILKIHAVTNKEHHREGLSIKEPSGSYLMSGSKLDFGDCYSGIATCKTLLLKNTTEASLHVELTSDRPKEVTFELKLLPNRARASRTARTEDALSPADSNEDSSRKGSLSPDAASKAAAAFASFESPAGYGADSDDDGDDNEGEFYDEDMTLTTKRLSFEENPQGDVDDADDDFEFDREPRPTPRSPPLSPKARTPTRASDTRRRLTKKKLRRPSRALTRVRDGSYESGADSGSICSSPERKSRGELKRRNSASLDDSNGSNFLVETLDLPPGVERTILVWYSPASADSVSHADDGVDSKACRLSKQTFRVSFRCFQIQGSWQQAQARVYDRTLGKSIHVRARTCTSLVTVTPSILHLGDCNIGELKGSACVLTNHSELPTTVRPLVTSKVISTVPNDDIVLGPKQSLELKVEIIPRKINPNYSRMISIINAKNKANISQVCVRSSNMDAHHVIYHSLFYKLLTPSKSAFLNFEHVAINAFGIQVFDLENITSAPLPLSLQTSDPGRVRLYALRQASDGSPLVGRKQLSGENQRSVSDKHGAAAIHPSLSSGSLSSQSSNSRLALASTATPSSSTTLHGGNRQSARLIRRRRSFGCEAELASPSATHSGMKKSTASSVLRSYLAKKVSLASATASAGWLTVGSASNQAEASRSSKIDGEKAGNGSGSGSTTPPLAAVVEGHILERSSSAKQRGSFTAGPLVGGSTTALLNTLDPVSAASELQALLELYEFSRLECDRYCHSSVPSVEKELEIVSMIRERSRQFQALVTGKKLLVIAGVKDRNIRIPAKSRQRIIAVFSPSSDLPSQEAVKLRIEKLKIFITLPPGGNKKAVTDAARFDASKAAWATSKHPFDSRPSVRELLVKGRVCRSVLNVNQKNINFGRITVSSRSSKKLVVQNMSAIPLMYCVEKTGSISSAFLEIKEGEVGVVKGFGTKEISFEFQPTLAGPFEEKLKITNVQDPENNTVFVTIKAKIVKRETFKLLQSGQVLSLGKCLVGEKSETIKIAVRNTSRKKREYAIQVDPTFSNPHLRPTFYFAVDDAPSAVITQAQEKKLDEELEKLEHKLRIAVTKKKTEKIATLNQKIGRVRALLSGEQVPDEPTSDTEEGGVGKVAASQSIEFLYDSNSESELSESEAPTRARSARRSRSRESSVERLSLTPATVSHSTTNTLQFTLEAEAIGRIVAYAIFHPVRPAAATPEMSAETSDEALPRQQQDSSLPRSQKARKRQLRKELAPFVGVGKLLLFEQQNKDVVKELQYNADVFVRTPAGEAAYYRSVGKAPLPPVPHGGLPKRPSLRAMLHDDDDVGTTKAEQERKDKVLDITAPTRAQAASDGTGKSNEEESTEAQYSGQIQVAIEPDIGGSGRRTALLVPLDECPNDTIGWSLTLTGPTIESESGLSVITEVHWRPNDAFRGLFSLTGWTKAVDQTVSDAAGETIEPLQQELPLRVLVRGGASTTVLLKWIYTAGSGFGSSTAIASCISATTLDLVSKAVQISIGALEVIELGGDGQSPPCVAKAMDVALVKTAQKSLYLDTETLDLGQHQQNSDVKGHFILRNRSRQVVKFLLLPSAVRDQQTTVGEFSFESSTGKVDAHSHTMVRFTFRGTVPGQHLEHILVRNLNDRLDSLTLNVSVRVTRPVYVRIPELDPHATGTLDVLDFGPCFVTPEMQDTSVDSPNVGLKFSKVHKLTLVSQVKETLVLCASSNLKTQCYVYEDARLHREATQVMLAGKTTTDLYVAVRPRLPGDAFKSGACRDLVGGIRVQLFKFTEVPATSTADGEDKGTTSSMVAEFTVKFVGVAGASLSRVVPSTIEFYMESPSSFFRHVKREGQIEIVNISKALPLVYRLFIVSDTDGYSDTDQGLTVELPTTKGEIRPGDSGHVHFTVSASAIGLFRRRILVENIHYPGKLSAIDLVLFVDNKTLRCTVLDNKSGSVAVTTPSNKPAAATTTSTQSLEVGFVPVIKLEEELGDVCGSQRSSGPSELEVSSMHRRYRIWPGSGGLLRDTGMASEHSLVLTNAQNKGDLIVRPISTLPLCFQWSNADSSSVSWRHIQPTAFSATLNQVRHLQSDESQHEEHSGSSKPIFYGGVYRIPPKSSCRLFFRFAPIAATSPLHTETISSGKAVSMKGIISIQGFTAGHTGSSATTLRMISLHGTYAESRLSVGESFVSLGKVGYSLGWRSSSFQLTVQNVSDIPACFSVCSFSDAIVVRRIDGASAISLETERREDHNKREDVPVTLSSLALAVARCTAWRIEPSKACVVEMEFVQTSSALTAGLHTFPLKVFNLLNPHNVEQINVSAQIVSSYADVTVDPESSGGSIGIGNDAAEIGFLPPVTIPPVSDSSGNARGPSFWFSVKNVFDEELSVTLTARLVDRFKGIADLEICSRSSNTAMNAFSVAPGDSVDIRVICQVRPSARITPDLFADTDRHFNGDLLTFGSVDLDITVQNMKDATQHKEILVRGKVQPGKTFTISSSTLHFYAVASDLPSDMPVDSLPSSLRTKVTASRDLGSSTPPLIAEASKTTLYQLKNLSETFWIRNPSTTQPLNFSIDQVPMHSAGLCVIKGASANEMYAMSEHIQAVSKPSTGMIPPGEAVKITVYLEEAPLSTGDTSDVDSVGSLSNGGKAASLLHKMRHHPSWRSNSWGAEMDDSKIDPMPQSRMFLTVRDVDMTSESALVGEIDVHLVLQSTPTPVVPGADVSKQHSTMDSSLLGAAFAAREKRLSTPKTTLQLPGVLNSPVQGERAASMREGSVLDHFEELDISSIRSGSTAARRRSHVPALSVRGCTPSESTTLETTRYVIDVGQHTVRNGGEVEWEITVESVFSQMSEANSGGAPDAGVEYRLYLVDQTASSWCQLSRDRGSLDRSRSYQSIVLYFLRDRIGVYSTFLVLQNVGNPGDLKIIQVKLEVVADLNALRSMTSGIDPATHLFRVLVSSHSAPRKLRRQSEDTMSTAPVSTAPGTSALPLVVDFGEVYYHKLYHNHSIVIENASSMTLDFTLSSSAQNEVSFSVSPTSFTEVTTVTLGARGRTQVFLHFRPRPQSTGPGENGAIVASQDEPWSREVEVYINCRLVKDFRETVVLRALCYSPQLTVHVASSTPELVSFGQSALANETIAQPTFLGVVFAMSESTLTQTSEGGAGASTPDTEVRYLVVHNTKDTRARVAMRNDSMFFTADAVADDHGAVVVDHLENGICAGRRSTVLVSIAPNSSAVFRITPDVETLRRHRQTWDHSVKEHITLYNIKQFAEHYQVTLCFTCSVTSYYIPPHIVETYPLSALEDTIAKFLQNYNTTWKWLISYHSKPLDSNDSSSVQKPATSLSLTRLAEVLGELEDALEQSSLLSPRKPGQTAGFGSASSGFPDSATLQDRETLRLLLQSYRALYFDFFYITDELIWYGVRSNAVRHSLMLADLAYGVVFNHEIFRAFLAQTNESVIFPRLLLPWSRQLHHFLSFFPESQEATRPLRQVYEQLQKFELLG